ncbi:MAG TPA: DinB family protein [Candidatus Sulfotelmatobacter sp.]|nr:DinB family protein [Candidatus Sulfotelmatobacter sp.]
MITPAERETLLKSLAESRERLLRAVEGLSREQLHYRPAPDRWTVAEIVEHVAFVEGRILGMIQKTLSAGPTPEKRSALEGRESVFFENVEARTPRLQAPDAVKPCGRWPDDQLLKEFEAARQRTREFAGSNEADLRTHFFPHPFFGDLDLYQWLLLIAAHCDRHRAQGEEVMASAGFPHSTQAGAVA